MKPSPKSRHLWLVKKILVLASSTVALLVVPPLAACAADSAPVQHVRGTISAIDHDRVTIATASGPVVVTLAAKTRYAGVVPGTMADITSGAFIGTANVPGPGAARALEVVVFPKAMAGTGEGDYAWDLAAGGRSSSAMTNGTVTARKTSAMTNATVTHVAGGAAKVVDLSYRGGTKRVSISAGVPIVRVLPGTRALVVIGAHVFVAPPLSAAAVMIVGEQGATPPM